MADSTDYQNGRSHERIDRDRACIKCGYNLRGLMTDAQCPECGQAIGPTIEGRWLRYADQSWLRGVIRGIQILLVSGRAATITIMATLILAVISLATVQVASDIRLEHVGDVLITTMRVLLAISVVGMGFGLWIASVPEPSDGAKQPVNEVCGRIASALSVPAFGLMISAHRVFDSAIPQVVLVQICVAAIVIHMVGMSRLASDLESRCEDHVRRYGPEARRRIPGPLLFAFLALAAYWWGPLRADRAGGWILPDAGSARALTIVLGLIWFALACRFRLTLNAIRIELAAARDQP
jgi:predicted RNA-binding Zn-ribbon protein involved in translation (DUF1610 family)